MRNRFSVSFYKPIDLNNTLNFTFKNGEKMF